MQKLNLELSTSQIACTNRFIILMMWLASTFNVLTYRATTSYVAGISTTSKSYVVGLLSTLNLPLALMGLHTHSIVSAEIYEVYISFTLFIHVIALWYIHWCTVYASIPIQGCHRYTEAWPFEVGSLQSFEWEGCSHRAMICLQRIYNFLLFHAVILSFLDWYAGTHSTSMYISKCNHMYK